MNLKVKYGLIWIGLILGCYLMNEIGMMFNFKVLGFIVGALGYYLVLDLYNKKVKQVNKITERSSD